MLPPATRPPGHLALIGMMAVGKSTVGRALAEARSVPFVDTDDQIKATLGLTVREIWERRGEPGYRPLERQAVRDALSAPEPIVLATPGGVAVDPEMAAAVEADDVTTVYLRAAAVTLAARIGDGEDHRPLLGDHPAAALARLVGERGARYEELADHIVDVDDRTPTEVVDEVLTLLAR